MKTQFCTSLLFGFFLISSAFAGAGHSIRVTLFGQPCMLEGPVETSVLKTVHAISPEQVYPTFEPGEKSTTVKSALEKLRTAKEVPNGLELYREQLGKRLENQAIFLSSLEESQRQKKPELLLTGVKPFFSDGRYKVFEGTAKKLDGNLSAGQRKEVLEQLFTSFSDILPSDPEDEFHKAIHRMKIQYVCSFEDSGSGKGDDTAE